MGNDDNLAPFLDVVRRYTTLGIQLAGAYNQAQAELNLGDLLAPGTLSTTDGRARSLATLDRLRVLTDTHREAYARFVTAMSNDIAVALQVLAPEQRAAQQAGTLANLQRHVDAQRDFYANRGRWIDAATGLCRLLDERGAHIRFDADGVQIDDDADRARFEGFLATIEQVHQREVKLHNERLARIRQSADTLGIRLH